MTEALRPGVRVLPRTRVPGHAPHLPGHAPHFPGHAPHLPAAEVGVTIRTVGAKAAAEVRRPYHLGTLLGISACAYAVSLAGVTWLQASSEAATAAARAPAVAAVDAMAAHADRLEQAVANIRERFGAAGEGYGSAVALLADVETRLDALAASVADVEARSLQLPTRIAVPTRSRASLPTVSRPAAATKPRTVATTGASGG